MEVVTQESLFCGQMARKNEWPLDRMVLQCDVTKKTREDMAGAPREGAYVHGLFMEGASLVWIRGGWMDMVCCSVGWLVASGEWMG